ncbi:uncharacterized protein LOC122201362 [Panthera leo]|uniref:uncharacterized protein LOC122201362 n=1 Tax=Panthera leo TaxID=9689 RepID=UPI001C6A840D|nr:uncharacterized protein LOC122201362 [Panthera leo]
MPQLRCPPGLRGARLQEIREVEDQMLVRLRRKGPGTWPMPWKHKQTELTRAPTAAGCVREDPVYSAKPPGEAPSAGSLGIPPAPGTARVYGVQPGHPTPPGPQPSEPALHPTSARLLDPGAAPPKGEHRGGASGATDRTEFTAGNASHSLAVQLQSFRSPRVRRLSALRTPQEKKIPQTIRIWYANVQLLGGPCLEPEARWRPWCAPGLLWEARRQSERASAPPSGRGAERHSAQGPGATRPPVARKGDSA